MSASNVYVHNLHWFSCFMPNSFILETFELWLFNSSSNNNSVPASAKVCCIPFLNIGSDTYVLEYKSEFTRSQFESKSEPIRKKFSISFVENRWKINLTQSFLIRGFYSNKSEVNFHLSINRIFNPKKSNKSEQWFIRIENRQSDFELIPIQLNLKFTSNSFGFIRIEFSDWIGLIWINF